MTEEKKPRVPSHASKMASLLRAYYVAQGKLDKADAALDKARTRSSEAAEDVVQAKADCVSAGFKADFTD